MILSFKDSEFSRERFAFLCEEEEEDMVKSETQLCHNNNNKLKEKCWLDCLTLDRRRSIVAAHVIFCFLV
jgi:hypothetical protein